MKKQIKNILLVTLVCFCTFSVQKSLAQYVLVTDPNFAAALCASPTFNSVMSPDCLSLDTNVAKTFTGNMQLQNKNINNIEEVKYFQSINFLQFTNNNITNFPDLSKLTALNGIDIRGNPWINISQLEPIKNQLTTLEMRLVGSGNLTDFSFLNSFTNLKRIQFTNYKATILPDFNNFTGITSLRIANNELTFKDILPLTTIIPSFSTVVVAFPQYPATANISTSVPTGSNYLLSIPVDTGISGITYEFYKDSVLIQSSNSNQLVIDSFSVSDAGNYYVHITHSDPLFVGNFITTGVYSLNAECPIISKIEIGSDIGCDQIPVELKNINDQTNYPYSTITLTESALGFNTYNLEPSKTINIATGTYHLYIKDLYECEYFLPNYLSVSTAKNCSEVFSPNGDGILDDFYVEGMGKAQIRDKQGLIIKELQLPDYWDGTDQKGNPAPIGLYIITFPDKSVKRITILR